MVGECIEDLELVCGLVLLLSLGLFIWLATFSLPTENVCSGLRELTLASGLLVM